MTRFIKCPICNNQAKREYYTGPFGIEEEYIDCSTCNYEFGFAYGNYKEVVGNKYFIWSHSTKYDNPIFKRNRIGSRNNFTCWHYTMGYFKSMNIAIIFYTPKAWYSIIISTI